VARHRLRRDGDDAEAVAARQRRQHAALVDAEHRASGRFAAQLQAGIAEARDHEGVGRVVLLHQPAQRQRDLLHVLLAFDAEWALGKRRTADRRAVGQAQNAERGIEPRRDRGIRVRIDDQDVGARHAVSFARVDIHFALIARSTRVIQHKGRAWSICPVKLTMTSIGSA
jgi:hypothetical protein